MLQARPTLERLAGKIRRGRFFRSERIFARILSNEMQGKKG
jgi:hypothetical protein